MKRLKDAIPNRHWATVITVSVVLLVLSFSPLVRSDELVGKIVLTLLVVFLVHVADRLFLFKDIKEDIQGQTSLLVERSEDQTKALVESSKSLEAMRSSGMVRMYATRKEASDDMSRDLLDSETANIRLIGISLNDFFREAETHLGDAWKQIVDYISHPSKCPNKKLKIQILIIDPECFGAQLRSLGEVRGDHLANRLRNEVLASATHLQKLIRMIDRSNKSGRKIELECRLYRTAPIMFLCHTDSCCYVEQYHFWSKRISSTPLPVLKYRNIVGSLNEAEYDMHGEMVEHFDWIWKYAGTPLDSYLDGFARGSSKGLAISRANNIYIDSNESRKRIEWLLNSTANAAGSKEQAGRKMHVWIQGVSLHSFFDSRSSLRIAMIELLRHPHVEVRILLLDPECRQAMWRSYREWLIEQDGDADDFETYREKESDHKISRLYQDTYSSLTQLKRMKNEVGDDGDLKVYFYDSAPTSFMLRVEDVVLLEQYHYGKSPNANRILGKEMPVIEFKKPSRDEDEADLFAPLDIEEILPAPYSLLVDHFEFVIDSAEMKDLDNDVSTGKAAKKRTRAKTKAKTKTARPAS